MILERVAEATPHAWMDWPRLRVQLCYFWRHRRLADLPAHTRFTELVQLRKLFDRDPRMTPRLDKLAVKQSVAHELGRGFVTPTVWSGKVLPASPPVQRAAILKARHGCNQSQIVARPPSPAQWQRFRDRSARWTKAPYGEWLDEWAYANVPRGLMLEPLLGDGTAPPVDYKVFVFGGCATHVQVHIGRGARHRWVLHDRQWRKLVPAQRDTPAPPSSLRAILAAAERLAAGFTFARVDFFEIDGQPRFSEYSFYPGSGLDPFAEDWIDFELGKLWLDALRSG